MQTMAYLPRALGGLFYYSPCSPYTLDLVKNPQVLAAAYEWQEMQRVNDLVSEMKSVCSSANEYAFSVLFEGQGEMLAPPWGSVYLHQDNLIMGETTARYHSFLNRTGVSFEIKNQPLDHFGLMLWALAALIESGERDATIELLSVHLLPWSGRYLELLSCNTHSRFYALLATLASIFICQLQVELDLEIEPVQLFK